MNKMKEKILVIDDEDRYRKLIRAYLEKFNFTVYDVASAADAYGVLRSIDNIDLVITDLMMPGEDGATLMKNIRLEYKIPVIAISGIYDEAMFEADNIEFTDGFLKKPFELDHLSQMIFNVLMKSRKKK